MQISPGQFAFHGTVHRHQTIAGVLKRQRMLDCIPSGQLFFKKKVVEMAIEQGAVHVEQDIVDPAPIDGLRGGS